MADMSDYLEQNLLDHIFNTPSFAQPATWIALYTTMPDEADAGGVEVSGGAYARQQVNVNGGASPTWDLAVTEGGGGFEVDNTHEVAWPQATALWGTILGMAVRDAVTAGNLIFLKTLATSKTVDIDDTFKFPVGDLSIIFR